jgi:hypothetical protein
MIIIKDLKADTINAVIQTSVKKGSHVITDEYKGYTKLKEIMDHQGINTSGMKEVHKTFPWVHKQLEMQKKFLEGFIIA